MYSYRSEGRIVFEDDTGQRRATLHLAKGGRYRVAMETTIDRRWECDWVVGSNFALTWKMAVEVASRHVTGKMIPKRLAWR